MFSDILHTILTTLTTIAIGIGFHAPATTSPLQSKQSTSTAPFEQSIKPSQEKPATTLTTEKRPDTATSTQKAVVNQTKKSLPTTERVDNKPKATSTITVAPIQSIPFDVINQNVRTSLVNIFCRNNVGMSVTGTGTVINTNGVILTNAHVGQYFALEYSKPEQVSCWLRTGSPAREAYKAQLLYISNKWVFQNTGSQLLEDPAGTGERDFALLLIATSTKNKNQSGEIVTTPTPQQTLPPALSYEVSNIKANDPVLIAGYSAGFLGASEIERNLYMSSSVTNIEGIYTFDPNKRPLDLIMMKGSISAQKGTSGGAVVGANGKLIGIVSIVTKGKTTNDRFLGAITIQHILESFYEEAGFTFDEYISGNYSTLLDRAQKFNEFSTKITTILNTKSTTTPLSN